ncbi:MAG: integrase core domain-containing protein [Sulfurovum sp.]|nr:integrase core domain-containing protein [Sulfurovum sp.]
MHLPHDGCRKIATNFNTHYAHTEVTVSKSYVYRLLKENAYEIVQQRKEQKNKEPYPMAKNHRWDMDLTSIDKQQILGIVDSGTRALISLKHIKTKRTINILRVVLDTIELYGKPNTIKTDNERVFTSKLMKFSLYILGIKKQTTQLASPWQNGKIERLFGTMKQAFEDLIFPNTQSLGEALQEFRLFYNHIRLHQNLDYNTPANAWDNKAKSTSKTHSQIIYFRGLCGNIAGYYFLE